MTPLCISSSELLPLPLFAKHSVNHMINYVVYGAGHAFGINLDKCFEEVQKSNMSKLGEDGKPIYNDKGKVMKSTKYFTPNLKKILE